jgi:hypothetical protein
VITVAWSGSPPTTAAAVGSTRMARSAVAAPTPSPVDPEPLVKAFACFPFELVGADDAHVLVHEQPTTHVEPAAWAASISSASTPGLTSPPGPISNSAAGLTNAHGICRILNVRPPWWKVCPAFGAPVRIATWVRLARR